MKFDAIVGNPPYQMSDGGNKASAVPLYHLFMECSVALDPSYISLIMPSRWYSGGRGLDDFREKMLNSKHIETIFDYANSSDCFPGVDISGGICYFLWSRNYEGNCNFVNVNDGTYIEKERNLNQFSILIRDNNAISILEKVRAVSSDYLSSYVSSQKPFGLRTFEKPDEEGNLLLRWNGGNGKIKEERVTAGKDIINKWKVIVSRVFFEHGGKADKDGKFRVLSILELLEPKTVCTETYVVVNSYNDEQSARNLYAYLCTKFVRFLILQASSSIMITRNSFAFVPIQDFSVHWTDEDLYKKYSFTEEEISYFESTIKPMGE